PPPLALFPYTTLFRSLLALDHARRVRARTERTRVALERVTVRCRPAREAMTLHYALKAASLRRARDADLVAHRELLDGQRLPDLDRKSTRLNSSHVKI